MTDQKPIIPLFKPTILWVLKDFALKGLQVLGLLVLVWLGLVLISLVS